MQDEQSSRCSRSSGGLKSREETRLTVTFLEGGLEKGEVAGTNFYLTLLFLFSYAL